MVRLRDRGKRGDHCSGVAVSSAAAVAAVAAAAATADRQLWSKDGRMCSTTRRHRLV